MQGGEEKQLLGFGDELVGPAAVASLGIVRFKLSEPCPQQPLLILIREGQAAGNDVKIAGLVNLARQAFDYISLLRRSLEQQKILYLGSPRARLQVEVVDPTNSH